MFVDLDKIFNQVAGRLEPMFRTMDNRLCELIGVVKRQNLNLEYEFGKPVEGVRGHDPAKFPAVAKLTNAVGGITTQNFAGIIGKTVTRGFVQNLGENRVKAIFTKEKDSENVLIVELDPSQVLDFSFFWDIISIQPSTPGDEVVVQVFTQ